MKKILLFICLAVFFTMAAVAAETGTDFEYEKFFTYYYQNPNPKDVPQALRALLQMDQFKNGAMKKNDADLLMAYQFGRVAQMQPSIVEDYKAIFEEAEPDARSFVARVLLITKDPGIKDYLRQKSEDEKFAESRDMIQLAIKDTFWETYDPLTKAVEHATDLDMLWTEFMTTGDARAVRKIIDVIERPDIMKKKILEFLSGPAPENKKHRVMELLRDTAGLNFDLESGQIHNKEDLGSLLLRKAQNGTVSKSVMRDIREALAISDAEFYTMVIKGAAIWALGSNAYQHDAVFEICRKELPERNDATRIVLLRIVGLVLMNREKPEEALPYFRQLSQLTPEASYFLFELTKKLIAGKDFISAQEAWKALKDVDAVNAATLKDDMDFLKLRELHVDPEQPPVKAEDVRKMIPGVIREGSKVKSYKTFMDMQMDGQIFGEWEVEFVLPDRYHVWQTFHEESGTVYDRWITIGNQEYFYINAWFQNNGRSDLGRDINTSLRLKKWIELLSDNKKIPLQAYTDNSQRYIVIRFKPDRVRDFIWHVTFNNMEKNTAEIWIDSDTRRIVKAALSGKISDPEGRIVDASIEQVFGNYNSAIVIEKPEEVTVVNSAEQ